MKTIISPPPVINNETLISFLQEICDVINMRLGNIPDDSTATDVTGAVSDLNALMEVLR